MATVPQQQLQDMLLFAIRDRNSRAVKSLLRHGADPNALSSLSTDTMLIEAINSGGLPLVRGRILRLLLVYGADPNRNEALHRAADALDEDSVSALLLYGADPALKNKNGVTPEMLAESQGGDAVVRLLCAPPTPLRVRQAPDRVDAPLPPMVSGMLVLAVRVGNVAAARDLLNARVTPNQADKAGNSALHFAVEAGPEMVELLLDADADVDARNHAGETPLLRAAAQGDACLAAAERLAARGCDLDAEDEKGWTARALASARGASGMAAMLDAQAQARHAAEQARQRAARAKEAQALEARTKKLAALRPGGLL